MVRSVAISFEATNGRRELLRIAAASLIALLSFSSQAIAGGSCTSSAQCDDGNPCTKSSCNTSMFLCVHTPKNCDDADPCTIDSCDAGTGNCVNAAKDCHDPDPCTDDICSPEGECLHPTTVCDDNSVCTRDFCTFGGCQYVYDEPCDDKNACTEDGCDAINGCTATVIKTCYDGDTCTTDVCHPPTGDCINDAIPDCTPTTTVPLAECGDANADENISAGDALVVLRSSVGIGGCDPCVCDVNANGGVTAGDALIILRASVGQSVVPNCPDC
jgi:hypothetical protein